MQLRHSFNLLVHCDLSSPALEFDRSNGILQVPTVYLQKYYTAFSCSKGVADLYMSYIFSPGNRLFLSLRNRYVLNASNAC